MLSQTFDDTKVYASWFLSKFASLLSRVEVTLPSGRRAVLISFLESLDCAKWLMPQLLRKVDISLLLSPVNISTSVTRFATETRYSERMLPLLLWSNDLTKGLVCSVWLSRGRSAFGEVSSSLVEQLLLRT